MVLRGGEAVTQGAPAAPPRVGLIASARRPTDDTGGRWTNGFGWLPEGCGDPGIGAACTVVSKDIAYANGQSWFQPFFVWAGEKCSTFDRERDWEARILRQLAACESKQLASEFWTGDLATAEDLDENRFLASPDSDVLTSSPASLRNALACLEVGLADCSCGQRGMIHAPRDVVTLWDELGLLRVVGTERLTIHDTIVVADAGYPGTGPNGEARADGSVWAYGTGIVDVRLAEVQVLGGPTAEGVNRSTNDIEIIAERYAAATWDGCCHVAVEIDAPACGAGS